MSEGKPNRRMRRAIAAAQRKGETFDPTKLKTTPRPTVPQKKNKKRKQRRDMRSVTGGGDPWALPSGRVPVGVRKRGDGRHLFSFVAGQVSGTPDEWSTPIAMNVNPRTLAKFADVPKLKVIAAMHQKYRVKKFTVEATPVVSSAAVAGSMLFISEGGSPNTPVPPDSVNICKERSGVVVPIGKAAKYTWVPPTRDYFCRPDGDISETTPGIVFVNLYLPTTNVFDGQTFTRPLWVISVEAEYEFDVFEDPLKSSEDAVISQPIDGQLKLEQDAEGTPVLTGEAVSRLAGFVQPYNVTGPVKVSRGFKNGILLITGLLAKTATVIPGPLGLLIRAGCVVAKLILAKIPSKSGLLGVEENTIALRIYGSVDDALEERPISAPGLLPVEIPVTGSITTLTAGQNPITTEVGETGDIATPHVQRATGPNCYVMITSYGPVQSPHWTPTTGMKAKIKIDNLGPYTISTSGDTTAFSAKFRVVIANLDGSLLYEGPLNAAPRNGEYDGKRVFAWTVTSTTAGGTKQVAVFHYDPVAEEFRRATTGAAFAFTDSWSGYSGVSTTMWKPSLVEVDQTDVQPRRGDS
uniref:Capsid protein n=1 Tax=Beihai fish astrovirus 1 TaxID=2116127 RepID=A0A2P1GND4_9VIRU|nr:capsid protein [Beihai fish astrovirus 1]